MGKRSNICLRLFLVSVVMIGWSSLCIGDTFVVTNTSDSGEGSLRWAIEQVITSVGADTIRFDIPTEDTGFDGTVWTIKFLSVLPIFADDSTFIDGFSQAINQGDTNPVGLEIVLDGSDMGTGNCLYIESAYNVISGLVISGFRLDGIQIWGEGACNNWIWGNFIGTNAAGNDTLGNGNGISISEGGMHNVVGGIDVTERNVISGNHIHGINIIGSDSNVVVGNFIGTDGTGTLSLGNGSAGISIGSGARGNRIGGKLVGERNVISGNAALEVNITGEGTTDNVVQGNLIGIDVNGNSALGKHWGIWLSGGASSNLIGGLSEGEANVISGCNGFGLIIEGAGTDSNRVVGNFIGTNASGAYWIGNSRDGVRISTGAQHSQIGPNNIIKHNGKNGVSVDGYTSLYNTITKNSISENGGKGIFLSNGGNGELAPPVIMSVGSVSGTAPPNTTVEVFSDSLDEGMTYEATVLADGSGDFVWPGTPTGPFVTATATDSEGNTSEFSRPKRLGGIVVINTNDSGGGSLRWAIEHANMNTGSDTIRFNISMEDGGFDGTVWTIKPLSNLSMITDDSTVIDGFSQAMNQGDTNSDGPEIVLDGRQLPGSAIGLDIHSAHCVISGLVVSGFRGYGAGIRLTGSGAHHCSIVGNYIGTNASGSDTVGNYHGIMCAEDAKNNVIGGIAPGQKNVISGNDNTGVQISNYADSTVVIGNLIGTDITGKNKVPNRDAGIRVGYHSQSNRIGGSLSGERNVISGNTYYGIYISGEDTRLNVIQGNYIGTDIDGTEPLGNGLLGILLSSGTILNTIGGLSEGEGNVISCNGYDGIRIRDAGTDSNQVLGNFIGTDVTGEGELGNGRHGIYVYNGAQNNQIGPGNTILYNKEDGVRIRNDSTWYNTITENSISENGLKGIKLSEGGNEELSTPVITSSDPVSGTAPPNAKIEIFSSPDQEGKTFEGSVFADASGNFTWAGIPVGPYVTATATDDLGNTSEFSDSVLATGVEVVDSVIPERFSLVQNYPNPFNPETMIRFGVKKPCRVLLKVYDLLGREAAKIVDERYQPGVYEVIFNAKGLSSGLYFYRIQMGSFQDVKKMVVLE